MNRLERVLLPFLLVTAITAAAWLLRDVLTVANFTMLYILAVLVVAIRWGTRAALVTASVSFLCINFFLVRPYYTFIVADPRDVIELIVFFIVAGLAGQLAARARQRADEAHQRAYEQEVLYRLTRSFNQITTSQEVYGALTRVLREDLKALQIHVLPDARAPVSSDQTVHYLLLQAGQTIYATLCVTFESALTPQQARLLNACGSQAAMALDRIELAERARTSQQFEEADRLKTAILRAVSHDLRTPITIIKTSAHNLRNSRPRLPQEEQGEIAETIGKEADHLDRLVGNLLDMSRLNAGALQLNCDLNSLEEVAGDVAARVWESTGRERIKMAFPDDFPLLNFDYGLVLQALSNLVDNSLRYEPPESQVELRACMQESGARLMVVNHGPALSAEERERIMEPFYHGERGHIGLGLPIAQGIIEAHHGRLWVEDTPGGGVTFIMALPSNQETEPDGSENPGR